MRIDHPLGIKPSQRVEHIFSYSKLNKPKCKRKYFIKQSKQNKQNVP